MTSNATAAIELTFTADQVVVAFKSDAMPAAELLAGLFMPIRGVIEDLVPDVDLRAAAEVDVLVNRALEVVDGAPAEQQTRLADARRHLEAVAEL